MDEKNKYLLGTIMIILLGSICAWVGRTAGAPGIVIGGFIGAALGFGAIEIASKK